MLRADLSGRLWSRVGSLSGCLSHDALTKLPPAYNPKRDVATPQRCCLFFTVRFFHHRLRRTLRPRLLPTGVSRGGGGSGISPHLVARLTAVDVCLTHMRLSNPRVSVALRRLLSAFGQILVYFHVFRWFHSPGAFRPNQ